MEILNALLIQFQNPITLYVTLGFISAIIIVWITKRDKDLVTLIWICGTFIWIVIWLSGIDTLDITHSIPKLLWWLFTAFLTSIAWIIASILISIFEKQESNKWEIDFLKEIKDSMLENTEQNKLLISELNKLNTGIWGDGDNSLVSQVRLLRTDTNDNHKALKKSFDDFAAEMANNNIDALTQAIEKVMWEFNTIINEKLSKTFDDFKQSVENLNVWQQEYKENITTSMEVLKNSHESLEKSSKWFEITVEKSEAFAGISEKLWEEIKVLDDSLQIFRKGINEFEGVAWETKKMSDSMIESINSLTDNFVSKAEKMVGESEKQIMMMREGFEQQGKDLIKTHTNVLENLNKEIDNNNKTSSEQFLRMQWKLEEQVLQFDKDLQKELEKSLKTLWEQLTWLSWKFVSDYWNLAEKLERLVSISK